MSILTGFTGTKAEALKKIDRQEEIAKATIVTAEAVVRLMDNPDFIKLLDDLKSECFDQTLNLAEGGQLAESASRNLSGISRFFSILNDYPRKLNVAKEALPMLAEGRIEVHNAPVDEE